MHQEELVRVKDIDGIAQEETAKSPEEVKKAEDQARKEILTRLMRGLHNFLRIDENGLPQVVLPSDNDKENAKPADQPKRAWCESSMDDEAFIAWIEQHWRETDALEVERRKQGGTKAYEERQKKRAEKGKSET